MAVTPMPQVAQINKTGSVPGMAYAQSTPMPQADPAAAAAYKAAANAYTAKNWGPNGTANGLTEAQNLTLPASKDNTDYNNRVAAFQTQNATPMPQKNISTPTSVPMPMAATPAPQAQGSFPGQLTNAQIQAEAESRIAKQIASAQTAATGALTGAKNAYDYTNQTNRDNRTLSNSMFNETHNPFTGQTGYAEANIARSNNLEDTGITNNYNAQVGQINQKLQDILTAAPGDQQAMIDQLTKQERDYGVQLGALTGTINGNNTMQQNQNNFNNGIAQAGLTGQIPQSMGGGQTQQAQAQSFNQNLQSNQFNQQAQNQGFNQNMQTQQFAYTQARDAIKDKQYQQQFDMDNQKYGLDYALKQATLNNQITNDQAQRAIGYMNANTSQQQANTSAANSAANISNLTADNQRQQSEFDQKQKDTVYQKSFDNLKSLYTAKDPYTGEIKVTNPQQLRAAILAKNLSDDVTIQMLSDFGLPIK